MDRIPKFRRKPKNPTIETAVERSSSDTIDSTASAELQAHQQLQAQQFQAQQQQQHAQLQLQPPPKVAVKPSKKSAFRNLRLRNTAKRARESPPVELPSSPPPAIVTHDGVKSRPPTADGDALRNMNGRHRQIPAFLDLSMQGKF